MSASLILAAMEVHVLMGWLPLHVCASQATLGCIVKRVGLFVINLMDSLLTLNSLSMLFQENNIFLFH